MKKKKVLFLLIVLALLVSAAPVLAGKPPDAGNGKPSHAGGPPEGKPKGPPASVPKGRPEGVPKAGAGKAPLYDSVPYTCEEGASDTAGPTFGFVIVNKNADGDLIVQVSLKRATPNETYDIWVNQHPGACPLSTPTAAGALSTNKQGNGNAHVDIPRVVGATKFWVSAVGGGQVLRSTAVPFPKAGAGKAPLYDSASYTCEEGASDTAGPTFGFVILNTNADGDLIVQVSLKRATPNETYGIWVNQDPDGCPLSAPTAPDALSTNRRGNGNAHLEIPRLEGAANFWVSAVGGGQVLRSTAVQLD